MSGISVPSSPEERCEICGCGTCCGGDGSGDDGGGGGDYGGCGDCDDGGGESSGGCSGSEDGGVGSNGSGGGSDGGGGGGVDGGGGGCVDGGGSCNIPGPSKGSVVPEGVAVDDGVGGIGCVQGLSSSSVGNNPINGFIGYSQVTSREYDVRPNGRNWSSRVRDC